MHKRRQILLGMAAGALWALAIVGGTHLADPAYLPPALALPAAFFVPGLVLIAMIGRLAQRRFFDDAIIDGDDFLPHSPAWIDQRVLSNTVEQLVLAIAIWPFVAFAWGGAVVLLLGVGFAVTRLAYWVGFHLSPPLRAFGFAGTFYPTILAAIWTLFLWLT